MLTRCPIQSTRPDAVCARSTAGNIAHTLWGEHAWLTPRLLPCKTKHYFKPGLLARITTKWILWPMTRFLVVIKEMIKETFVLFVVVLLLYPIFFHSGAVETLFLMPSRLSDTSRPHPKSARHDKKKQRGKSRQRTSGADSTTYVELSGRTSGCL